MVLTGQCHPVEFAAWSTPEWVVVSGGDSRDADVVREAYTAQGATLLHTDDVGAVHFRIERGEVTVYSWRDAERRSVGSTDNIDRLNGSNAGKKMIESDVRSIRQIVGSL